MILLSISGKIKEIETQIAAAASISSNQIEIIIPVFLIMVINFCLKSL